MNLKQFATKYGVISVVISITLLLFIISKFDKCSNDHTTVIIDEVERSAITKHIVDSMLSLQAKRDVFVLDSINLIREKERIAYKNSIDKEKKKVQKLEIERDTLLAHYNNDSTSQSGLCDDIIATDTKIINSQKVVISVLEKDTASLSLSLQDTKKKYFIEIDNHNRTKDLNVICKENQERLIKELQKNNTWWRRNEKWIYFGGGFIVAVGTASLITK